MARQEKAQSIFQKVSFYNGKTHTHLWNTSTLDDPDNTESTTWSEVIENKVIWEALLAKYWTRTLLPSIQHPLHYRPGGQPYRPFWLQGTHPRHSQWHLQYQQHHRQCRTTWRCESHELRGPGPPTSHQLHHHHRATEKGFKDGQECTSSSPTGLHYGHLEIAPPLW